MILFVLWLGLSKVLVDGSIMNHGGVPYAISNPEGGLSDQRYQTFGFYWSVQAPPLIGMELQELTPLTLRPMWLGLWSILTCMVRCRPCTLRSTGPGTFLSTFPRRLSRGSMGRWWPSLGMRLTKSSTLVLRCESRYTNIKYKNFKENSFSQIMCAKELLLVASHAILTAVRGTCPFQVITLTTITTLAGSQAGIQSLVTLKHPHFCQTQQLHSLKQLQEWSMDILQILYSRWPLFF